MSQDVRRHRTGNCLIDQLDEDAALLLASNGPCLELSQGEILYQECGPISHVYFPISGCCCHVVPMNEGRHIEATTIGREGMLGIHLALGLNFSPLRAVSIVPGQAIRIPAPHFLEILRTSASLDKLLKKYAAYCLRLACQTIACNATHAVEQRVARRLLMAHDRVGKDEFSLTQELLGQMLGVRRQTITLVAGILQTTGLIDYRRGVIKILDRTGLEAASCECYQIAKTAYDSIVIVKE